MPDITVSRPGQIQAAGAVDALFLKQFSGEVLATFARKVATAGSYMEKRISAGKSWQFPALSRATSKRFTVGDNILNDTNGYLSTIKGDERVILVDSPIISAVVISDIDEAMNHFETRAEYVNQLAEALALDHDTHVLSVGIAAARTDLTFAHADYVADRVINGVTSDAESIVANLLEAAKIMDKNDVPSEGRICFLRPDEYYALMYKYTGGTLTPGILTNADYNSGAGTAFQNARIPFPIAGFEIRMTKNLPSTDKSGTSDDVAGTSNNDVFSTNGHGYNGDFSDTVGLCVQRSAVGSVKLWDVMTKAEYKLEAQGYLTVSRLAEGHGVLRPEAAVELSSAA
jgi:hypothetical protein